MKNAILWQWAKENGYTPQELAEALGYKSPRYVEQVLRGWEKVSYSFIGRFALTFPNHVHIFANVSGEDDHETQAHM